MAGLSASMSEFGDISGIVWNKRNGYLVAGHQRVKAMTNPAFTVRQNGTYGDDGDHYIQDGDAQYPIRLVDWPDDKHMAAMVAANRPSAPMAMYAIKGLCHRTDMDMGRHGFSIDLHPFMRDAVQESGLTQERIDGQIEQCGRAWLDAAGFDRIFDPDNCGFDMDREKEPGPNAGPAYKPLTDLRVRWGEWGPEHITVPGNACGLDIDERSFGCVFKGGSSLSPHNVDSLNQKYLLLMVFTEIVYKVVLFEGYAWSSRVPPERIGQIEP